MFERKPIPIQPQNRQPEKKQGCKIRIKKSQDGRVVDKEIINCSPSEIKALMEDKSEE